jgi:predicted permease
MFRRVIDETLADWQHERRTARGPYARCLQAIVLIAAIGRVVSRLVLQLGEGHPVRNLGRDFQYAWRRLRATPKFATFAVVTLALGIGATTATYSVVHAALGPPPGVAAPERLVNITHSDGASIPMIALSYGDYRDLRARQTTFQGLTGWAFLRPAVAVNDEASTEWIEASSGEYFQVLGVLPQAGRTFGMADDEVGATPVAVISDGGWHRLFGGAADVIGRWISINGVAFQIVGVAPREFAGLFNGGLVPTTLWVPLNSLRALPSAPNGGRNNFDVNDRSNRWIQVRARLRDGIAVEQARAEVQSIARTLDRTMPLHDSNVSPPPYETSRPWLVRPTVDVPIGEWSAGVLKPLAATLMGAVGLVLLVACTNLANLMLARSSSRRQELAIRLAMGASRWRVIRESLVEGLLLAAGGGLGGLLIARVLLVAIGRDLAVGSLVLHLEPRIDLPAILMSLAATSLALLVTSLAPAWQSTRADVRSALAADGSQASVARWRGRRWLIAAQVTVSFVLAAVAALSLAQVRASSRQDEGVNLARLAVADVDFTLQNYDDARVQQIVDAALAVVTRRPDVEAAAWSTGFAVGMTTPGGLVGLTADPKEGAALISATSGLFATLGVSIVHGRPLSDHDTSMSESVGVISARTANRLFGRTDAVGQSIFVRFFSRDRTPVTKRLTVVGVAADTDTGEIGQRDPDVVYLPLAQQFWPRLVLTARATGDPEPLVGALRKTLASVAPGLAVAQSGTGQALTNGPSSVFLKIVALLSGVLGALALILALAGLYGVLSHLVERRTREIGVRMALGAARTDMYRMVVRDGLRPVVAGVVIGLLIGVLVRRALTPFFARLLPTVDPAVMIVLPLLMLAAGVVAAYLPARRAARVDPNVALREL